MGNTNSTERSKLNVVVKTDSKKNIIDEKYTSVLTGNEEAGNFKNKFNGTYTLSDKELSAQLLSYYEGSVRKGSEFQNEGLNDKKEYAIYGQPDKWVVDYRQRYQNCGIVSCLNILSMAGVKDVFETTTEYEQYLKTPQVVKKKVQYVNGEKQVTEVTALPKKLYDYDTEEKFTLELIQKSPNEPMSFENMYKNSQDEWLENSYYIMHSKGSEYYKKVEDIVAAQDGGTYTCQRVKILNDYGVKSHAESMNITLLKRIERKTPAPYTEILPELPDASVVTINRGEYKQTYEETYTQDYGNEIVTTTITRERSFSKKLVEDDSVEVPEGAERPKIWKVFVESEIKTVKVVTDYYDTYTQGFEADSKALKHKEEVNVYVTSGVTNFSDIINTSVEPSYEKTAELQSDLTKSEETYYTNSERYTFIEPLAQAVIDGKGVILSGCACGLRDDEKAQVHEYEGHAITLVGVVRGEVTLNNELDANGDAKNTKDDIVGFFVIDSGGWLSNAAKGTPTATQTAQFISVKRLYNFLTDFGINEKRNVNERYVSDMVVTDENIRNWGDELNLTGNIGINQLYGNHTKNVLSGGKSADVLFGYGGNDTLLGGDDGDFLDGGAGDDYIDCGSKDKADDINTVVFKYQDSLLQDDYGNIVSRDGEVEVVGQDDIVVAPKGKNVLQFDNIDISKIKLSQDNNNLILHYHEYTRPDGVIDLASTVTIQNYFKNATSTIDKIVERDYLVFGNSDNKYNVVTTEKDFFDDYLQLQEIYCSTDTSKKAVKLLGTRYKDNITGGFFGETIEAGEGSDTINGGAGNDIIKCGSGNDTVVGSYGDDKIYLESGEANKIIYGDSTSVDNCSGNDIIYSSKKAKAKIIIESKTAADVDLIKVGNDLKIMYDRTTGASTTISGYFKSKGKTSVEVLELNGTKVDLVGDYNRILSSCNTVSASVRNQTIFGNTGGVGDDVIKGSGTIYGGYGNDTMYAVASGGNTYKFDKLDNGYDTIYTKGTGTTVLDFTETGIDFSGQKGIKNYVEYLNEFSYTKQGNALIINYAVDGKYNDKATVKLADFFKSKNDFVIKYTDSDNNIQTIDLKTQIITYMEGIDDKKNKINGSFVSDYIVGGSLADTIKAGGGDDVIIAGKGNDKITGGTGNNRIIYYKGDGSDTINLTKHENLTIEVNGFDGNVDNFLDNFSFRISKGNLLVEYTEDLTTTTLFTIKNFGKKDVTTDDGSVILEIKNERGIVVQTIDLRKDAIFETYDNFTNKKYKYTGTWHSDVIDASNLNNYEIKNKRGATINAGNGDDIIKGSRYNDTINGGNGNDTIAGVAGNNKINGGNGSDKYLLFVDKDNVHSEEHSTINDTGKGEGDVDTAIVYSGTTTILDENGNIKNVTGSTASDIKIWYNVDDYKTSTNVQSGKDSALLKGVEKLQRKDVVVVKEDLSKDADYGNLKSATRTTTTTNTYNYNFVNDSAIANYVRSLGYKDVATLMQKGTTYQKEHVQEMFDNIASWGEDVSERTTESICEIVGNIGNDRIEAKNDAGWENTKYVISTGNGDDVVFGGENDDIIMGEEGDDRIRGLGGNDIIYGGNGDDTIYGGEGDDTIYGGNGNDYIEAGNGINTVNGGNGSDTYEIFKDINTGSRKEETLINDTGVFISDVDIVNVNNVAKEDLKVWFNTEKDGKYIKDSTIKVEDQNGNSAELKGIEELHIREKNARNQEVIYNYKFDNYPLEKEIKQFFKENSEYKDVAEVIYKGKEQDRLELLSKFDNNSVWKISEVHGKNGDEEYELFKDEHDTHVVYYDEDVTKAVKTKTVAGSLVSICRDEFGNPIYSDKVVADHSTDKAVYDGDCEDLTVWFNYKVDGTMDYTTGEFDRNPTLTLTPDASYIYITKKGTNGVVKTAELNNIEVLSAKNFQGDSALYCEYNFESNVLNAALKEWFSLNIQYNSVLEVMEIASSDIKEGLLDVFRKNASWKVIGSDASDTIYGGPGNDVIYGYGGDDYLFGNGGDDEIHGGLGNDHIEGGTGNDLLYGDDGNDEIRGESGNDTIYGGEGDDRLYGGTGIDKIFGGEGCDYIEGNEGNDYIYGGGWADTIYGGAGDDIIYGDVDTSIDSSYFEPGNDTIYGGEGRDIIYGGGGADIIYGEAGSDSLYGNEGDDYIYGGDGDDIIYGGEDNDKLYGQKGDDYIYGGEGNDYIEGNEGDDYIEGNEGNDEIHGGIGNDTIYGGEGNDTIYAEDGDDIIYTGSGDDIVYGSVGNDQIHIDGNGSKTINGQTGSDTYYIENKDGAKVEVTIDDTGSSSDIDTTIFKYSSSDIKVWYNCSTDGDRIDSTINVVGNNLSAVLKGVESVKAQGEGDSFVTYSMDNNELKVAIQTWFSDYTGSESYGSVNDVMNGSVEADKVSLLAVFADKAQWTNG